MCVEPSGRIVWSGDLKGKGIFQASPTAADGKIYMMNFAGEVFVVQAGGSEFKLLLHTAEMAEGENTLRAAIPISQGQIFIRVIGKYNSITRAPMNRAQHGGDTAGGVFNEGKPPRCRGEKVCEARRGVAQRNREDILHEAHRLGFHLLAPARLCRLHIARCRAVRAVIEKMNSRIERPQAAHVAAETRVWCRQQGLSGQLLVGHWLHDGSLAGNQSIGRSKPNSVGISSDTVG